MYHKSAWHRGTRHVHTKSKVQQRQGASSGYASNFVDGNLSLFPVIGCNLPLAKPYLLLESTLEGQMQDRIISCQIPHLLISTFKLRSVSPIHDPRVFRPNTTQTLSFLPPIFIFGCIGPTPHNFLIVISSIYRVPSSDSEPDPEETTGLDPTSAFFVNAAATASKKINSQPQPKAKKEKDDKNKIKKKTEDAESVSTFCYCC